MSRQALVSLLTATGMVLVLGALLLLADRERTLLFSSATGDAAEPRGRPASGPATSRPAEWPRPRSSERLAERRDMVEYQIRRRGISSEPVLEAMRAVPRHWFTPGGISRNAYEDRPLPVGEGQTISQPYIVALMTESLEVEEGDKVLEIGTGSGYQAAVLNELTPHVFSVEIIGALAERAAATFQQRGYDSIAVRHADGYFGWEEHAPFDAIIVTCAASHVPPTLIRQLRPGGRMCVPVGGPFATQRLLLITKKEDGTTTSRNLSAVAFVPMTGQIERK